MPEKKKQHFIPKFLLRHFANDAEKKLINIFNVDQKFYKMNCPLKHQGQENYFYGKDGIIENGFAELESAAAHVISNLTKNHSLPEWRSENSRVLFLFTMLLSYRTKSNVADINEMVDKIIREIMSKDQRFADPKYDDLHFKFKNPAAISLGIISEEVFRAYDLGVKLIINQSSKKFITSDHPAISYNQYLEQRKYPGGHLGMFAKGLQLFFPISPECMLIYYDKWAYKIGNRGDLLIQTKIETDVEQLNCLQVVNCTNLIYSNNFVTEFELASLSSKNISARMMDRTTLKVLTEPSVDKDGLEHINYEHHGNQKKIKLNLSFIKQTKKAKAHKFNNYVVQLRDEDLRDILPNSSR